MNAYFALLQRLRDGDEPAIRSCNPKLAFKRTKVLVNGDQICDHVFYVKREGKGYTDV
jgi:hypothetical protein